MRQFKITSANLTQSAEDDCVLSPDDPIHQLMGTAQLGELGGQELLAAYAALQVPKIEGNNKGQIAREQNIKPGTDEWFKHWFGDKR